MRVKFWGVRGSIPVPGPNTLRYGGNTPCVEVRCGDTLIIIDAGTGIRELGNELMAAGPPVHAHLLITHTHWDHLQGFPFFAPAYVPGHTIQVYGCYGSDRSLEGALQGQMSTPYFPVRLEDARAHIHFQEIDEGDFLIDDVRVEAMFANHPGLCLVYRLEWAGRKLVYLSDNEPYGQLASSEPSAPGSFLAGVVRGIDPRLARFAREADLLIIDCPYDADEYKKRRGWGHGAVEESVEIALEARVRRLALYHHDPGHSDDKIDHMVETGRELIRLFHSQTECFGAAEGMVLEL